MSEYQSPEITGTCVVTGAAGFMGSHLVRELLARGSTVVALRRSDIDFDDSSAIVSFLDRHKAAHIIHLAAQSNPTAGDTRSFYDSNAFTTERLLSAATAIALPGRFLMASATSVYGDGGQKSLDEDAPRNPLNHYGASKLLAEVIAEWYRPHLDITIARPSNCIGRGQKPSYLVPKLVSAFAKREPEIVMGDRDIARDMVDIRDAVDILCRTLMAPSRSVARINVASGRATPIHQIISTLSRLTGHQPIIKRDERFIRQGDMRYQACSIDRALSLGHQPRHSLEDTLSWMLDEVAA